MANLPDELWSRVMEIGVQRSVLGFRDICCMSICCRRLRRLSGDGALWSALLDADFPSDSAQSSFSDCKSLYQAKYQSPFILVVSYLAPYGDRRRFERQRARKLAARRLAILKEESLIAEHSRRIEEIRSLLAQEREKLRVAVADLRNLDRVRRASVAVQVWQPEVVRSSQRQLVEQCTVPIESRASALEMEIKLCKHQISVYGRAFKNHERKLSERKEALESLRYHPVESFSLSDQRSKKRKKQKG